MKQRGLSSQRRRSSRNVKQRFQRPSWMWRWHRLLSAFVALFGLGMAVASLQFGAVMHPAMATTSDNVRGWLWADGFGWVSVNDQNPGACGGACGTYGVNVDTATRQASGWAWSDGVGWLCFGSTCTNAACQNDATDPLGLTKAPDGANPTATLNAGSGVVEMHGWAKVCAGKSKGWISLNCADMGTCGGPFAYKVQYDSANKRFYTGLQGAGNYSSIGWNGFSDGTGFGYVDLQYLTMNTPNENTATPVPPATGVCSDSYDNDFNGQADCSDPACASAPNCQEAGNCADGLDNDGNGQIDCAQPVCAVTPTCAENTPTKCHDGIDNDADGLIDCAQASCIAADPTCSFSGEAVAPVCGGDPNTCCSNNADDDSNAKIDCADSACVNATVCTPAWLQTQFGNVYALKGIEGSSQKSSTATYCLSSQGAITGFTSNQGCLETGSQTLTLPSASSTYKGTLGSLDVNGILAGRYGQVINVGSGNITGLVPNILSGKVYHAVGNVTLNAKTFQNGVGSTGRGNGLLIVEGTLTITGNLDYASTLGIQYLRNLASLGVIVKKDAGGNGGNINIDPAVRRIVGVYFAENAVNTGTACPGVTSCPSEQPLQVFGLMAARQVNLQRNYRDLTVAAEQIQFDGRGVANPPPGMQDVAQSLPQILEGFSR